MKIRRFMTLMELVVAMGLTALLLTTLTFFYQQMNTLNKRAEQLQQSTFEQLYLESRLAQIFPQVLPHRCKGGSCFYTTTGDLGGLLANDSQSLVFVFHTGVDLEKNHAVNVLARLYLDKQQCLCLASWPLPKIQDQDLPPMRKEILLEGVKNLRFKFYIAPERNRTLLEGRGSAVESKKKDAEENTQSTESSVGLEWVSEWKRDYGYIPFMLKLELTLEEKDSKKPVVKTFAFPIPRSTKGIIYGG